MWQRINALPTGVQKHIGKLFVGNKQWAQSVVAMRKEHPQQSQVIIDLFWQERLAGMCGM